jgi:predicted transcriptional regulator
MRLVSVKITDDTRQRVANLAATHHITAHAVMVQAIESAVERLEPYDAFVNDALAAREAVYETGKVYDGAEFSAYLRAKVRGEKAVKPRMKSLKNYLKAAA